MQTSTPASRFQIIILALAVIILLPTSLAIYSKDNKPTFAPVTATSSDPITNAQALHNWLPDSVYSFTLARLKAFAQDNDLDTSSMTIKDSKVSISSGNYTFGLTFGAPTTTDHNISVSVTNYDSVITSAVYIDDQLQDIQASTQQSDATFSGLDTLVNYGMTTFQSDSLKQAFETFAPNAGNVTIDVTSITSPSDNYEFNVFIDSTQYHAVVTNPDLTSVTLKLTDAKTNKQVYDSGTVNAQD